MPTSKVILVDPFHKARYTIISSAFPLPFKVENQAIWQNHSEILHHCPSVAAIHHPFCKYEQLFHEQSQNNSIKVSFFQLLHLHISVNMAKNKSDDSSL